MRYLSGRVASAKAGADCDPTAPVTEQYGSRRRAITRRPAAQFRVRASVLDVYVSETGEKMPHFDPDGQS